jgi:hypothetical protein
MSRASEDGRGDLLDQPAEARSGVIAAESP